MTKASLAAFVAFAGFASSVGAAAITPTAEERAETARWAARFDGTHAAEPAFSFAYGGKSFAELASQWDVQRSRRELDGQRTEHTIAYRDPKTGLVVRWVAVVYGDFPVVEWTVWLRNTSAEKTPLVENLQGLDVTFPASGTGRFVLRGNEGDHNVADSYAPYEQTLWPNTQKTFAPVGGRPCDTAFPYFNLALPDGGGLLLAVGWPGQWATTFAHRAGRGLQLTAGQELTRLYLEPGEEIRTPLIALLFWKGNDVVRSQNLWRRWMVAHNLPRPNGQPPRPMLSFCDFAYFPWSQGNEADEKRFIDALVQQGIDLDYWWIDANWFPGGQGQWEVARDRFPNGLKGISDYVHQRKMGLITWFEPEAAYGWSLAAKSQPQAILRGVPAEPSGQGLFYLGDPTAREWMTNHIDRLIREEGIDLYRQDMNLGPLSYWRSNDEPDRLGLHENLHVQGYLAFWDELLRRHPGMLIDSCAGGGRRNDLETLRRSIPLLRSDYQHFGGDPQWAIGNQGHTYGIASWIPYFGEGVYYHPEHFVYSVRSYMTPALAIICDVRKNEMDWDLYRRLIAQWRQLADGYLGDYYPLTRYSLDETQWIAWQFDRPEEGDGFVQAFRRQQAAADSLSVKFHGLESEAVYAVTNLDTSTTVERTGHDLFERGFSLTIAEQPGSAILSYRKKSP